MANETPTTTPEKRKEFETKFNELATPHLETYNGKQPVMFWHHDKEQPHIEEEFFYHLPQSAQDALEILMAQVAG